MKLNQSESTSVFRLCLNTDLTRLSRFPRDSVTNQNTEKSTPRIPRLCLEKFSGKNPQKIHMSSSSLGLIFCKQKFSPPYFQNNLEINFSIIYTSTSQGDNFRDMGGAQKHLCFTTDFEDFQGGGLQPGLLRSQPNCRASRLLQVPSSRAGGCGKLFELVDSEPEVLAE